MKRFSRILSVLLALVMCLSVLPVTAMADLTTGHSVNVRFVQLLLNEDFYLGYSYGKSESTTFICQYSTGHSDTAYNNHTIARSDIKAAANRLGTRSGYTLAGWTKSASKNPSISSFSGTSVTCNKGDTIYIVYKVAVTNTNYTLSYDANGGSGAPNQQRTSTTASSWSPTISTSQPTRVGYEFLGWSTSRSATSPSYFGGSSITLQKGNPNMTLYAVWKEEVVQAQYDYKLVYNANGGTDAPGQQEETTTTTSCTFTVSSLVPTQDGYTFLGWSTDPKATKADYEANDSITLTNNNPSLRLYAVWTKAQTELTFEDVKIVKVFQGLTAEQIPADFSISYVISSMTAGFGDEYTRGTFSSSSDNCAPTDVDGSPAFAYTIPRFTIPEDRIDHTWSVTIVQENNVEVSGYTHTLANTSHQMNYATDDKTTYFYNVYTKDPEPELPYTITWHYTKGEDTAQTQTEGKAAAGAPVSVSIPETTTYSGETYAYVKTVLNGAEIDRPTEFTVEDGKANTLDIYYELKTESKQVTVTWLDGYNSTPVQTGTIEKGAAVPESDYPADPQRSGYNFTGWGEPVVDEEGNITITAQWSAIPAPVIPNPPYIPMVPVIPAPGDEVLDIREDEVPLSAAVGLNLEDHFAYIAGYPDGTVQPNGNITRAEVATIFFRLLTDDTRAIYWSQENDYSDVTADSWYNNAISTLSNMGVISGYPDGSFKPNAPITRAEFVKIAVSFFEQLDALYDGSFTDVKDGQWFTEYVAGAVKHELVGGYPDGTFRPTANITRAEACAIVNRVLERKPHVDHLLPEAEMNTWPDNSDKAIWYYADMQEATNSHDYDMPTEDEQAAEVVEQWTEKLPERDWQALELEWADANAAPGGEAAG